MSDDVEMIPVSWGRVGKRWVERRDVERIARAVYSPEGKRIEASEKPRKKSGEKASAARIPDRSKADVA
jgi:hypothetical protein